MSRSPAPAPASSVDPVMAFPFVGGRPCLNFVATLGKRRTERIERLPDPDALARWIIEAGLRADPQDADAGAGDLPEELEDVRPGGPLIGSGDAGQTAAGHMHATGEDLTAARALREALHRVLFSAMGGHVPDPADVAQVNKTAARADLAPQLTLGGAGGLTALNWRAAQPVQAALATVARDAVLLVGGPLLARVKECENPECTLLFLDDSQARRRRWCSMERCGNLVKIAGYRSRMRGGGSRPVA
ncbi:CGNR zinc finger domain-containing protein [Sphaerisporangium fuscum]|uniref:CGNR zinc finger domain-containing protein n=1 Tax=Sphaerisporangium fuscum TaxID=2835868 RepID=UPI001BDD64FB|nr:ABATE domain-containing protein [Sphaerisporangium fuscum]